MTKGQILILIKFQHDWINILRFIKKIQEGYLTLTLSFTSFQILCIICLLYGCGLWNINLYCFYPEKMNVALQKNFSTDCLQICNGEYTPFFVQTKILKQQQQHTHAQERIFKQYDIFFFYKGISDGGLIKVE